MTIERLFRRVEPLTTVGVEERSRQSIWSKVTI